MAMTPTATTTPRNTGAGMRRPTSEPSTPPTTEPTAMSPATGQLIAACPYDSDAATMKTTAATAFTSVASTFLAALTRWRRSSRPIPRIATSSTP